MSTKSEGNGNQMKSCHGKRQASQGENEQEDSKRRKLLVATVGGRQCAQCQELKPSSEYSANQRKKGTTARCRGCVNTSVEEQQPSANKSTKKASLLHTCGGCHRKKHAQKSFSADELLKGPQAKCISCAEKQAQKQLLSNTTKKCSECEETKKLSEFPKAEHSKDQIFLCQMCWHWQQVPSVKCFWCRRELKWIRLSGAERRDYKRQKSFAKISCRTDECHEQVERERTERAEVVRLGKRGTIFYDCSPKHVAVEKLPKVEDEAPVEGEYSILFCKAFGDAFLYEMSFVNRTTRGTFTLEKSLERLDYYRCRIDFDKTMDPLPLSSFLLSQADCTMEGSLDNTLSGQEQGEGWCIHLDNIFEESFDANLQATVGQLNERRATLKVLKKSIAFPWKPMEGAEDVGVRFDTMAEAKALAQEHECGHSTWISRQLGFPPEVAKLIHSFAANWRPPPVFFVEPGDLHLCVEWDPSNQVGLVSELILRKVKK